MNRFTKFEAAYQAAVENIELHQEGDLSALTDWMLETDANPYSYLPKEWGESLSTAEGFSGLLDHIHHAVYDDGDITFVKVNGEPRIVFYNQHEDDFRDHVLTSTEKYLEKRWFDKGFKHTIEVLKINPNEFGPLYEEYHTQWVKQCFMNDAKRDIECAAKHYRMYKCFEESWIEEVKSAHKAGIE